MTVNDINESAMMNVSDRGHGLAGRRILLMRYASKQAFVERMETSHSNLVELLQKVPPSQYRQEGVWGDGCTIRDLLAHLTEWDQMLLTWYRADIDGQGAVRPAPGHK